MSVLTALSDHRFDAGGAVGLTGERRPTRRRGLHPALIASATGSTAPRDNRSARLRRDYPSGQKLNDDPIIYLFDNFLDEVEIEALIAAAKTDLKRGLTVGDEKDRAIEGRTGANAWIEHDHTPGIQRLANRISDLVGLPLERAEAFQVLHYGQNQEYVPHHDGWDPDTDRGKHYMNCGGQRMLTCLFYLNDVAVGGGTCFPNLDLEVRAVRGRMMIFHNCDEGTNLRNRNSRHGGLMVEQGEKWAANLWFRERTVQTSRHRSGDFSRVV